MNKIMSFDEKFDFGQNFLFGKKWIFDGNSNPKYCKLLGRL